MSSIIATSNTKPRAHQRSVRSPEAKSPNYYEHPTSPLKLTTDAEKGQKWCLNDFEVGKFLGKGKYGKVYVAREKSSKHIVALKMSSLEQISADGSEQQVQREIEIQSNLRHTNILRLYGYFYNKKSIYLILECAPGCSDLYGYLQMLKENGLQLSMQEAATITRDVASALDYMHSKNVVHRDLKPENLLLGLDGKILIADFGMSFHGDFSELHDTCGTPEFMSPQCIEPPYDHRVDHWALGVLLYELLTGRTPFATQDEEATKKRILNEKLQFESDFRGCGGAQALINGLLEFEPDERPTLKAIQQDPWILRCI